MTDMALWIDLRQLSIACLLALPIGLDRERENRGAGLRTFPLVCLASCGMVLLTRQALGTDPQIHARVLQGLMTGIGFIGGGAILKGDENVRGTATAASIWNVGVIGAAVGFDRYGIAVILALVNILLLRVMVPLKRGIYRKGGA